MKPGDLVTRIDGEPVANWNLRRYEQHTTEGYLEPMSAPSGDPFKK